MSLEPPKHFIERAIAASLRSPCRSKRGVLIFREGSILGVGFNNKPPGFFCDASAECKATCVDRAVHAEQAALLSARRDVAGAEVVHVKTMGGALVASGGPSCVQCSKLLLHAGVDRVWLYEAQGWTAYDSIEFHALSLASTRAQRTFAKASQP